MGNDIVVVGASGFAKEMLFLLKNSKNVDGSEWNICGLVDETYIRKEKISGHSILGNDEWLLNYKNEINVVIGIGDPKKKMEIVEKLKQNKNIMFPNIIAQSVRKGDDIQMGEGCIICDMNILTTDIKLGDFVTLNLSNTIGHDTQVGNYVTINPGCNISGNVQIEDKVLVGTGSKIIQGIKIGEESILGAGTVIVRDIEKRCTVVGNPGRVIKKW